MSVYTVLLFQDTYAFEHKIIFLGVVEDIGSPQEAKY
jgi:hypothetical protein